MAPARIAIVHYHLRPGGVTSVIERAQRALEKAGFSTVLLCGSEPCGAARVIPALAYDAVADPRRVADEILRASIEALGAPPDVVHVHNHSLGRNLALPAALLDLARRGQRMLLQIHDFAEDGRPANFRNLLDTVGRGSSDQLCGTLYPSAPHVHYAALNPRDLAFLRCAGLPTERGHHLPNCVSDAPGARPEPASPCATPSFIYPTRAIRRKNLGEFLLGSAVSEEGSRWAVSLAPTSAADRVHYESWMSFAAELGLPVEFEAGIRNQWSLAELLRHAHAIVTTSVAEGFGLAYLEPWLAGRPLYGRDLPEITMGLKESGLQLDHLYPSFLVPVEWIGAPRIERAIRESMEALWRAYGRALPPGAVETACQGLHGADEVDFGKLDEAMQRDVIRRVRANPELRAGLQPGRLRPEGARTEDELIRRNRLVVAEHYSLKTYGDRLARIYAALMGAAAGPVESLSGEKILDGFLDPARFRLLRT